MCHQHLQEESDFICGLFVCFLLLSELDERNLDFITKPQVQTCVWKPQPLMELSVRLPIGQHGGALGGLYPSSTPAIVDAIVSSPCSSFCTPHQGLFPLPFDFFFFFAFYVSSPSYLPVPVCH